MRITLAAASDNESRRAAQGAQRALERARDVEVDRELVAGRPDIVIAVGDNRFLLDTLRDGPRAVPVLAVGHGFLAELPPSGLIGAIPRLLSNRFVIEERLRLGLVMDGRTLPPALNEVALTSSRGGGFLRYSIEVDGERVWRDGGDGVVLSTPTGSTGYGLSAGGPIVMENAQTIVVVPICSANGQRPLVLPRESEIAISDIESRVGRVVVVDGQKRFRVRKSGFTVKASESPARFVRFGKARYLQVFGKLHSKRGGPPLPVEAAPSAKFVHRLLSDQGALSEKQLVAESGLPERTVRNALSYLLQLGLVRRVASLRDAREAVFAIRT